MKIYDSKLIRQGHSDFDLVISMNPGENFVRPTEFVDDEQLVFDGTWDTVMKLMYGLPLLAFTVWLGGNLLRFLFELMEYFVWEYFAIALIALSVFGACLLGLTYIIINPSRRIVFNRLEGTITMPASKWRWLSKKTVTQPFTEAYFTTGTARSSNWIGIGVPGSISTFLFLPSRYGQEKLRDFSALVWYMDKNRPLPPGAKLDPHREKDYNRRKAEGFPEPLFRSRIDTPEWEGADEERKQALALQGVVRSKKWKSEGLKKKKKKRKMQ